MPHREFIMSKYVIVIEDDPDDSSNVNVELTFDLECNYTSGLSIPPDTLADKIKDIIWPVVRGVSMVVANCETKVSKGESECN